MRERNLQQKLLEIYPNIGRSNFGRRPPTAREVEEVLGIRTDESSYPPQTRDIFLKDEGEKESVKRKK